MGTVADNEIRCYVYRFLIVKPNVLCALSVLPSVIVTDYHRINVSVMMISFGAEAFVFPFVIQKLKD